VADRLGVQIWYIVGGGVCMGMGILAFFVPSILNLEDHRAAPEAGESEVTPTSGTLSGAPARLSKGRGSEGA
jgi:hypothetical protein